MRTLQRLACLTAALLIVAAAVQAQELRRWSINYSATPFIKPVATAQTLSLPTGRGEVVDNWSLTGTWHLTDKWAVEGGYYRTAIRYGGYPRRMEGMQLGGKRYFLRESLFLQPFIGVKGQFNLADRFEWHKGMIERQTLDYRFRNPRFSAGVGAGLDFYLLSSLALTIQYDFMMGLDGSTSIQTLADNTDMPIQRYADRGMYHHVGIGAKITFPFRMTEADGATLFSILFEILHSSLY